MRSPCFTLVGFFSFWNNTKKHRQRKQFLFFFSHFPYPHLFSLPLVSFVLLSLLLPAFVMHVQVQHSGLRQRWLTPPDGKVLLWWLWALTCSQGRVHRAASPLLRVRVLREDQDSVLLVLLIIPKNLWIYIL